jgi:hypothetical protein
MSIDELVQITEKFIDNDTLTIGVSTTFWKNEDWPPKPGYKNVEPVWVLDARNRIESKYPSIKWSMGGARTYLHNQSNWFKFYNHAEDDYLRWLNEISKNTKRLVQLFDIRESCNIFHETDYIQPQEVIPIELGRGCMFKCKFCAYDKIGKKPGTYSRNFDNIRRDIIHAHTNWGTTKFYYVDDTVNESESKVQALADIAQSMPFELEWIGYVRPDLIWSKPNTEQWLKDSGLRSAFFGIESFEAKSSLLVGKGWSGKHGKDWLLEKRQKWGNSLTWQIGMIVGLPGQTIPQLEDDCNWLINNDMHLWSFVPLWLEPGYYQSEFSNNAPKYGFTFPDVSRPYAWHNKEWTFDIAYDVYTKLNAMSNNKHKVAGWQLGEYSSLGYSMKELMSTYVKDLQYNELEIKSRNFLNTYIQNNLKE